MNIEDVVYVGIKLYAEEVGKLLTCIKNAVGINSHKIPIKKIFCDHLTIAFGKNVTSQMIDYSNTNVVINARKLLSNGKICCIVCDNVYLGTNKYDHITISTDGNSKPVESNNLIQQFINGDSDIYSCDINCSVKGIVGLYCKDGVWRY